MEVSSMARCLDAGERAQVGVLSKEQLGVGRLQANSRPARHSRLETLAVP